MLAINFKSFLILPSAIRHEFLKILAILVLISYKPVSDEKACPKRKGFTLLKKVDVKFYEPPGALK